MILLPYDSSVFIFLCVDGWANISKSIAGAMNTGAFMDRYVVISMLSAMPFAILPRLLAVQGAISMASAHSPSVTWLCHVPSRCEKKSLMTGLDVRADNVIGVINSLPAGVMTTCTSAPFFISNRMIRHALYAAMLPLIPHTIFFPFSILLSVKFAQADFGKNLFRV